MSLRLFGFAAGQAMTFTITPATLATEGIGTPRASSTVQTRLPAAGGEWNFQEVTVEGPSIKFELNGTVIVDADVGKVVESMGGKPHPGKDRTSGYFGFANVSIKPLD